MIISGLEIKEKLNEMPLDDVQAIVCEGMKVIYNKLQEEGFGYDMMVAGRMQGNYNDIIITDITDMRIGELNYNFQTYKMM